jgi:hypothetical protein
MNGNFQEVKVPITVGKMYPSGFEYFGPEQHDIDMQEIVSNQTNPLRIIGKIKGDWLDDLDVACQLATKDLYTSRDHHSDYLYVTQLSDAIPTISKIPKILGFTGKTDAQIQMQRPGCNMPKHVDPAKLFVDPYRVRILVMLAHWEYGQYLFFNNTVFREWKAGTIIYTDYANVWHSTANMSSHTRPILQITGEPSNELQDMLADNKEHVFQL